MKNLLTSVKTLAPWRNRITKLIAGIVIGAALGFGYYKFVGCSGGTCPITGNPFISTLYGAIMGAVVAGING
jgi:hypothetical protein